MLVAGTIVDEKFEIISRLGTGGYGTVYKARQTLLDRTVALKLLDAAQFMDAEARARFDREAKSLSMMQHKGLTTLYGYGSWRNAPYMVMECLNGKTLQQVLEEQGSLSISSATEIVRQIGEALATIHANGIVHRDLKPANIMLIEEQEKTIAKIIDFGLVWINPGIGTDVQKLTEMGETVGTAEYMSPEQCMAKELDLRSDIYALGCIYFACLTQRPPFAGDSIIGIMRAHCDQPPMRLAKDSADKQLVAACQSILDRALEKEPDRRYQTVEEMLADLQKIAKLKSTTAVKININTQMMEKRPGLSKLVFVGVMAATAIAASCFLTLYKPAPSPSDIPAQLSPSLAHEAHLLDLDENPKGALVLYRQAVAANEKDHLLSAKDLRKIKVQIVSCLQDTQRYLEAYGEAVPMVKTIDLHHRPQDKDLLLANAFALSCLHIGHYEEGLKLMTEIQKVVPADGDNFREFDVRIACFLTAKHQCKEALAILQKYHENAWNGWPGVALCEAKAGALECLGQMEKAKLLRERAKFLNPKTGGGQ